MARKVQISKEIILKAALELLIAEGFSSINIKTLSDKIGCSTQPLVWHFGNMEGLRNALAKYALDYANDKMRPKGENPVDAFEQVGRAFVSIAVDEPNLYRFLYVEGYNGCTLRSPDAMLMDKGNSELIKDIASYMNISEEGAGRYLQSTIIFSNGIATLVATGAMKATVEEMMELINRAADAFLLQEGALVKEELK